MFKIYRRGVINFELESVEIPSKKNVDLTNKHKQKYEIGLFYSETPQSKAFSSETFMSKDDKFEMGSMTLTSEKAYFQEGSYVTKSFDNMFDFASFIQEEMTCNHYMTSGTYYNSNGKESDKIVYTKKTELLKKKAVVSKNTQVISRSQEFIIGRGNPGIMCIDIDQFNGRFLTLEEVLDKLFDTLPELKNAPMVIFPSTGSNIYGKSSKSSKKWLDSNGEEIEKDSFGNSTLRGDHGFHIFVGISKASWLTTNFFDRINQRFWINKGGFISISSSGNMLERCLVDLSVLKPVQPIYTYANIIGKEIFQKIGEPWIINPNAKPFNILSIEKLTHDEEVRYKSLVEEEKELLQEKAEKIKKNWAYKKAEQTTAADKAGKKGSSTRKIVVKGLVEDYIKTAQEFVLKGQQELYLTPIRQKESGNLITIDIIKDPHGNNFIIRTVEQILENPDLYHGARCACIEDLYYSPGGNSNPIIDYTRGRVWIKHEPFPRVFDFAHGGTSYRLLRDKVEIDLVQDDMSGVIDNILNILKKRNCIYKIKSSPLLLELNEKKNLELKSINKHIFKYILSQHFSFFEFNKKNERIEIWPNDIVAVPALELFQIKNDCNVRGVNTIPYLDISGKLRVRKGYDPSTGFIYDEKYENFYNLENKKISIQEMKDALKIVEEPISKFKFSNNVSKANMLAGMFTAVLKQCFNNDSSAMYPGFIADAPGNGIGKTKLLQIIGILCKGIVPGVSPFGDNEDERRKLVGSKLMVGNDLIFFDNVKTKFDSEIINSIMTSKAVSVRVLGKTLEVEFDNNTFILVSGKNLLKNISTEFIRRFLVIRIEPVESNYLSHDFGFDPAELVLNKRFEIVEALMVLYIGFTQNCQNPSSVKIGSFTIWSDKIGACVKYIGEEISEKVNGELVYNIPGKDIVDNFQDQVEGDLSQFNSFMSSLCKIYKKELDNRGFIKFSWKDIMEKTKVEWVEVEGVKVEVKIGVEEEKLKRWLEFQFCKSGKKFISIVKYFSGNIFNSSDKKEYRFLEGDSRNKIYTVERIRC